MAKKSTKPAPHRGRGASRGPRKEPYDARRVSAIVERIREQAVRLSQLARSMDDANVSGVVVDGHAMLLRGLNQIDNFTDNAFRSVRVARSAKMKL